MGGQKSWKKKDPWSVCEYQFNSPYCPEPRSIRKVFVNTSTVHHTVLALVLGWSLRCLWIPVLFTILYWVIYGSLRCLWIPVQCSKEFLRCLWIYSTDHHAVQCTALILGGSLRCLWIPVLNTWTVQGTPCAARDKAPSQNAVSVYLSVDLYLSVCLYIFSLLAMIFTR